MSRPRPRRPRLEKQQQFRRDWADRLNEQMAPFQKTAGRMLDQLDLYGQDAALPSNLSLPMIVELVAGYVTVRTTLECSDCVDKLNIEDPDSESSNAVQEASMGHAWLVTMLLMRLGERDSEGKHEPWLPDWAMDGYEAFIDEFDMEGYERMVLEEAPDYVVHPIYFAFATENWMSDLVSNFMTGLLVEFGLRMESRWGGCPALRELAENSSLLSLEEILSDGYRFDGMDVELWLDAVDEAEDVFQRYLRENLDDGVPPPPLVNHVR